MPGVNTRTVRILPEMPKKIDVFVKRVAIFVCLEFFLLLLLSTSVL